jgi:hypothetical protein
MEPSCTALPRLGMVVAGRIGTVRALLVVVVVALLPHLAAAENPNLIAARQQYQAGEQERALAILSPLLTSTTLDEHERASALRLAGCAESVLGHEDAALARFVAAFAFEPDEPLERALETVDLRELYERARGEWRNAFITATSAHATELAQISVAVDAPARAVGGEPLAIAVHFVDPGHFVSRVELAFRRRGVDNYTLLAQRVPASLAFAIPAAATESERGFAFEYRVTLRAQTGFDLAHAGDANHPRVIQIAAGHVPRWHEHWWVRGLLGTAVLALGAGGYLAYRSIDAGPQHIEVHPP